MSKEEPFSDLVENLLEKFGLSSVTAQIRLRRRWEEVVGPLLSAKSTPIGLRNGLLTVAVRTHAWAQELQLQRPNLLERIDAVLGTGIVRDIRFKAGSTGENPSPEVPSPGADGPEETAEGGPEPEIPGLDGIPDAEMRAILRSIARRAVSRRSPRRK